MLGYVKVNELNEEQYSIWTVCAGKISLLRSIAKQLERGFDELDGDKIAKAEKELDEYCKGFLEDLCKLKELGVKLSKVV